MPVCSPNLGSRVCLTMQQCMLGSVEEVDVSSDEDRTQLIPNLFFRLHSHTHTHSCVIMTSDHATLSSCNGVHYTGCPHKAECPHSVTV